MRFRETCSTNIHNSRIEGKLCSVFLRLWRVCSLQQKRINGRNVGVPLHFLPFVTLEFNIRFLLCQTFFQFYILGGFMIFFFSSQLCGGHHVAHAISQSLRSGSCWSHKYHPPWGTMHLKLLVLILSEFQRRQCLRLVIVLQKVTWRSGG